MLNDTAEGGTVTVSVKHKDSGNNQLLTTGHLFTDIRGQFAPNVDRYCWVRGKELDKGIEHDDSFIAQKGKEKETRKDSKVGPPFGRFVHAIESDIEDFALIEWISDTACNQFGQCVKKFDNVLKDCDVSMGMDFVLATGNSTNQLKLVGKNHFTKTFYGNLYGMYKFRPKYYPHKGNTGGPIYNIETNSILSYLVTEGEDGFHIYQGGVSVNCLTNMS